MLRVNLLQGMTIRDAEVCLGRSLFGLFGLFGKHDVRLKSISEHEAGGMMSGSAVRKQLAIASKLAGKKIAALMTDGFEEAEYIACKTALEREGAEVCVVSPRSRVVTAWDTDHWGNSIPVDESADFVDVSAYSALLLPGGSLNPDKLRRSQEAVDLVNAFLEDGKPVAAICRGPQIFTETEAIRGRRLTSFPPARTELENAGANWVDEDIVVDGGIVTARSPDCLAAFSQCMIEQLNRDSRHA